MMANEAPPIVGVTPYLTIRDGRGMEAAAFYMRAFAATEVRRHLADDGKRVMHIHLAINGGNLFLSDDFPEFHGGVPAAEPGGTTLHLEVDNADAWWERAVKAGAEIRMPLADQFWGDRYGKLRDPFGHSWSMASPIVKVETQMAPA
jgi:PhnB protein